jgi:hypothetical protein
LSSYAPISGYEVSKHFNGLCFGRPAVFITAASFQGRDYTILQHVEDTIMIIKLTQTHEREEFFTATSGTIADEDRSEIFGII